MTNEEELAKCGFNPSDFIIEMATALYIYTRRKSDNKVFIFDRIKHQVIK